MPVQDFTHFKLDEEVRSISGHYCMQKEKLIPTDDGEILCYTGYSVTDSSCCGVGGCSFSFVPGFIRQWHYRKDSDGNFISEVEPIRDENMKKMIIDLIKGRETCTQVNFL